MKKLFLTSGVILCMACPAFADPLDITTSQDGQGQYLLTDNTAANCSTPKTLTSDDSATTFYAKWKAHKYHVIYNPKESSDTGSTPVIAGGTTDTAAAAQTTEATYLQQYTVFANTADSLGALPNGGQYFTRLGYTFSGWKSAYDIGEGTNTQTTYPGTTDQTIAQYKLTSPEDVNLYAQWTPDKYNVVYNIGEHAKTGSTNYTDPKTTAGMTFDAAYTALTFNTTPISTNMQAADGYTFCGWSTSSSQTCTDPLAENAWKWTGTTLNNTTATSDLLTSYNTNGYNVYAVYAANGYTLTYDCGQFNANRVASPVAGEALATGGYTYQRTYDAAAAALLDPREVCELGGYHVTGGTTWTCVNTSNNNSSVALADVQTTWKVAGNVTCTASWTANTIGLAWDAGQGATAQSGGTYSAGSGADTCTYDLGITVGAAPKKAGYDFHGWTTDPASVEGTDYFVFPSETAPTPGTTVNSEPATPANNG